MGGDKGEGGVFSYPFVNSRVMMVCPENELSNPTSPPFNSPLTKGGYRGVNGGMGGLLNFPFMHFTFFLDLCYGFMT
jgi:hypothetical protein